MKKDIILQVDTPALLMEFLINELPEKSRKDIKALLAHKSVVVGNKIQTKFDYPLRKGQTVTIDYTNKREFLRNHRIELIFEDDYLIAISKPAGLLSVADDDKNAVTVFKIMNSFVRLSDKSAKIHIVHRLDRDTSGVMVLAKSTVFRDKLQDSWNELTIDRRYYAVTEGVPQQKSGVVTHNLRQNKNYAMYNSKDKAGEKAITEYNVVAESDFNALIDVAIKTGKKNQIRVAMRDIGHSIVGDRKYGAKSNPLKRLGLHAYMLRIKNPFTNEIYCFESKMPKEFRFLFKRKENIQ